MVFEELFKPPLWTFDKRWSKLLPGRRGKPDALGRVATKLRRLWNQWSHALSNAEAHSVFLIAAPLPLKVCLALAFFDKDETQFVTNYLICAWRHWLPWDPGAAAIVAGAPCHLWKKDKLKCWKLKKLKSNFHFAEGYDRPLKNDKKKGCVL